MKKSMVAFQAFILLSGLICADQKQNIPSSKPNITAGPKPFFSTITVLSPNGGETWGKGSTAIITWSTSNVHHHVNIILKATNAGVGGEFTIRVGTSAHSRKGGVSDPKQHRLRREGVQDHHHHRGREDQGRERRHVHDQADQSYIHVVPTRHLHRRLPGHHQLHRNDQRRFPVRGGFFFFNHDDGTQSHNFTTYNHGILTAYYSRQVTGSKSGHTTLYIVSPLNQPSSNTAYFSVNCAQQVK